MRLPEKKKISNKKIMDIWQTTVGKIEKRQSLLWPCSDNISGDITYGCNDMVAIREKEQKKAFSRVKKFKELTEDQCYDRGQWMRNLGWWQML